MKTIHYHFFFPRVLYACTRDSAIAHASRTAISFFISSSLASVDFGFLGGFLHHISGIYFQAQRRRIERCFCFKLFIPPESTCQRASIARAVSFGHNTYIHTQLYKLDIFRTGTGMGIWDGKGLGGFLWISCFSIFFNHHNTSRSMIFSRRNDMTKNPFIKSTTTPFYKCC